MKLNDIVMASTQDTKIRVVVKLYGTSFRTEHFPEYFLESEEIQEPEEIMDGYTLITMMQYIELTEERVSSHGKADGFEPKDVQGN